MRLVRAWREPFALLMVCSLLGGCSVNPATGKSQLNFYNEQKEIQMGNEADAEILDSVGLYDDPDLQDYIQDLGSQLAAQSERPNLPWTFKVLDDSAVNAFALPGGHVYITRGLLTHLETEAEVAEVLGHEIGHVTARHGVNQASKQLLVAIGIGAAVLIDSDLEGWAGLAEVGFGVLFLKYSRDDERQADDLGLRYLVRTGYDPRLAPEVFGVLEGVSKIEGAGRLPNWLATHPDPGSRRKRLEQEVAALDQDFAGKKVERDSYLQRLDGMVFGDNPRDGYFQGSAFVHPDMRFRFEFPEGWETANQKAAVTGTEPGGAAMLQVALSDKDTPGEADDEFFAEDGVTRGKAWDRKIHGLPAHWARFEYDKDSEKRNGTVAFVSYGDQVFQVLAFATPEAWKNQQDDMENAIATFSRLDDPQALAAKASRVRLVRLTEDMTLEQFSRRYPSTVKPETLALINHVPVDGTLAKGTLAKRVVADAQ
jgi:predicted Zn-dependent protease